MVIPTETIAGLRETHLNVLICPACGGGLTVADESLRCAACQRVYPCKDGVSELFYSNELEARRRDVTPVVRAFYEAHPFPDYEDVDSPQRLREKATEGVFARLLDEQVPKTAWVLDAGCGTGQLSNFLAMSGGRNVFGADLSVPSLALGARFARVHNLDNVTFCQMNLFRPALRPHSFDLVVCNGVLHHTSDPQRGFEHLVELVKEDGMILIGLYNAFGRVPTHLRRAIFRVSGGRLHWLDPRIRTAGLGERRRLAWLADQYEHPHESDHTMGQVLGWFHAAGVEFVNSIPKTRAFEHFSQREQLFVPTRPGDRLDRFMVQLGMLLRGGPEGGFFLMIGCCRASRRRSERSAWDQMRRSQGAAIRAAAPGRSRILLEFWEFLREEKKFWLLPILVVLGLLGLLIVFSQTSVVTPFIYTLF